MTLTRKLTAALFGFVAFFALVLANEGHGAYELVKAFAFGADDWTRATYNDPATAYIKINQAAGEESMAYSPEKGYGYVNSDALDRSPNNRGVYTGDDEIYDQFIGAKKIQGIPPMLFRIDLENGNYRFVAAGGDAANYDHATIIRARDGETGPAVILVDDFQPTAAGQFWTVEFADKIVPPASTIPPMFIFPTESPLLAVTQGYIIIEQDIGVHPAGNGGDLCLLEVWDVGTVLFASAGHDRVAVEGETVTLDGSGSIDAEGFFWEQIAGTPAVEIVNSHEAVASFVAPDAPGSFLTFRLTVTASGEEEDADTVLVFVSSGTPVSSTSVALAAGYFREMLHLGSNRFDRITGSDVTIVRDYLAKFGSEANVDPGPGDGYDFSGTNISTSQNPMVWTPHTPGGGAWPYRYGDDIAFDYWVMYYHVDIFSPGVSERDARLRFRHDDQVRGWNNGGLILSRDVSDQSLEGCQDFVLHPGLNSMTFKLRDGSGANYLAVRITDRNDNPFSDLRYTSYLLTADAGPDQAVLPNSIVTLDGSRTTNAEGYIWEQISGPELLLSNPHSINPTLTVPEVPAGTVFVFRLSAASLAGFSYDTAKVCVSDELPVGFSAQDIGISLPGSTAYDEASGTFIVSKDGLGIGETADDFRFVYTNATGDFAASVRVDSVAGERWPKGGIAGIMIRQATDPGSVNVAETVTPYLGVGFQSRRNAGGPTGSLGKQGMAPLISFPVYLGVQRRGNAYYGWESTDGVNWEHNESFCIPVEMGEPVLVGMCLSGHDFPATATARFSEFSTSQVFPLFADAGPDFVAYHGGTGLLDGSRSLNAESYFWEQTGGTPVEIQDLNQVVAQFATPEDPPGTALTFQLTVWGPGGASPDLDTVQVFLSDPLPGQFVSKDIGTPVPGHTVYDQSSGTFSVSAKGYRLMGTAADEFHFVYTEMSGDFAVSVRLDPAVMPWPNSTMTCPGIMVRQTDDPGSAEVVMVASRNSGFFFGCRTIQGAVAEWPRPIRWPVLTVPYYLGIQRRGNTFYGWCSLDGVNWVHDERDVVAVKMEDPVLVGMCFASGSSATLITVQFSQFSASASFPAIAIARNQGAIPGDTVTLDGSSSLNADSYEWSQVRGPAVEISAEPGSPIATFAAPTVGERSVLTFKLTATGPLGTDNFIVGAVVSDNLAFRTDATPIARVTESTLTGLKDIRVIKDGRRIEDYDTYDGYNPAGEDWYGFLWSEPVHIESIVYYQGSIFADGGWWTSLTVQYTPDGINWLEAGNVIINPPYDFSDCEIGKVGFRRYILIFDPVDAIGIRIYGEPGGPADFTTIGELEVYSYVPGPPSEERINEAIEAGLTYLRDQQNEDGSWTFLTTYLSRLDVQAAAPAVTCLLNHGVGETDPTVQKGLTWITSCQQPDGSIRVGPIRTSETALAILALCATGNRQYDDEISAAAQYLVTAQTDTQNQYYGGWSISKDTAANLSYTWLVLVALHHAEDFNTESTILPPEVWQRAETFLQKCQNRLDSNPDYSLFNDGGFTAVPPLYSGSTGGRSSGYMTAAGLCGFYAIGTGRADPRVDDAFGWLEANFALEQNYPIGKKSFYDYVYSLAMACVSWNETTLAGHTWYNELAEVLLDRQELSGHWATTDTLNVPDIVATCQAILALQTKLVPEGSSIEITVESPVDLHVYDAEGRHVGINYETGETEEEIPGSSYFLESDTEPQHVRIQNPIAGTYSIQLVATGTGEYTLTVAGFIGDAVVSEQTYTGTVEAEEVHAAAATVSAIAGPVTTQVSQPAPLLQLQPVELAWGEPAPGYSYESWPLFQGWKHVRMENPGGQTAFNVTARIMSCPQNFTVVDPEVEIGDVGPGLSEWSQDTFAYTIDMRKPVQPQKGLVWRITYDDESYQRHTVEGRSVLASLEVPVDIKPGTAPNSINLGSSSVVPAAFLTTPDFDASVIDPRTVMFGGYDFWGDIKLRGKKDGVPMASLEDVDGDGDLDLVVHVEVEYAATEPMDVECQLRAFTYGGFLVWGRDSVRIVPPR